MKVNHFTTVTNWNPWYRNGHFSFTNTQFNQPFLFSFFFSSKGQFPSWIFIPYPVHTNPHTHVQKYQFVISSDMLFHLYLGNFFFIFFHISFFFFFFLSADTFFFFFSIRLSTPWKCRCTSGRGINSYFRAVTLGRSNCIIF